MKLFSVNLKSATSDSDIWDSKQSTLGLVFVYCPIKAHLLIKPLAREIHLVENGANGVILLIINNSASE